MRAMVIDHLERLFSSWADLANDLPEDAFASSLPVPSNRVGEQFWCLIGARESYAQAVAAGAWGGFSCSLSRTDIGGRAGIVAGLASSARSFRRIAEVVEWNAARERLLLDLLEHEAQHQGQLIRYVYALGYRFPDSWCKRWALG